MRLRHSDLQRVVKNTMNERKTIEYFKNEIVRVLGPRVSVDSDDLTTIAESANYTLDVMERTGKPIGDLRFKQSILAKYISSKNSEVRKFLARTLTESVARKMVWDHDDEVRHAAAKRLSPKLLEGVVKKYHSDEQLALIYEEKLETETPYTGDSIKQGYDVELSDEWYSSKAKEFLQDYSSGLDYGWEPQAIFKYADDVRSISGIEVDGEKLLKAIESINDDDDEEVMEESFFKQLAKTLKNT